MSDFSEALPNVGNSFDYPKMGLHIAHSNSTDPWAMYAAGNGDNIIIAFTGDYPPLRIVFLTTEPNKKGYLRSYNGWANASVDLVNYDSEKGAYYGTLVWPAPVFYTGMPFNGSVSDPFTIFPSINDIIDAYEPWVVTKPITVSWKRQDGKILTTTFDIKVKPKE